MGTNQEHVHYRQMFPAVKTADNISNQIFRNRQMLRFPKSKKKKRKGRRKKWKKRTECVLA